MRTLLCLLCFFRTVLLYGESFPSIRSNDFPFASELPSNEMTDIYQDGKGYIWIGTSNGLARYDGHSVQTFRSDYLHPDLLTNNRITAFAEDSHYIYIGTGKGLNIYDRQTMQIRPHAHPQLRNAYIYALCTTHKGYVWISGGHVLYRIAPDNGRLRSYKLRLEDGTMAHCNSLFVDHDDRLWICSRSGLMCYDERSGRFFRYPAIGTYNNPSSMFQDKEGRYWILTWGDGLWQMLPDSRAGKATFLYQPLDNLRTHTPDERFFSMTQDDVYGYLWALSYNSLYALRMSPHSGLLEPVDLGGKADINKMYTRIIKDHDGNLWLSSYDHGSIISFPAESIGNYPLTPLRRDLQWAPNLLTLCRDGAGNFWFNQDRFGICLQQAGNKDVIYGSPELRSLTIDARVMAGRTKGNGIWSADISRPVVYGLQCLNGEICRTEMIDLGTQTDIKAPVGQIMEGQGDTLWLQARGRIAAWDSRAGKAVTTDTSLYFHSFAFTDEGAVLGIAADNIIYILTPDSNRIASRSLGIKLPFGSGEKAGLSCVGNGHKLWLTTSQGRVCQVDIQKKTCTDLTTDLIKDGGNILNILSHGRYLWLITHCKIIRYDVKSRVQTAYPVPDDFMTVRIFRDRTACIDHSGTLYAGGNGGFISISPSPLSGTSAEENFPIVLSDLRVNGKSIFFSDGNPDSPTPQDIGKQTLSHKARNIEIDFATLHFRTQAPFRYMFRMEGADEQWITPEVGTHTAFYNKLGKGLHRFYVKYCDVAGHSSEETLLTEIIVEPAWWETTWAYLLYAVAGLLAAGTIARLYVVRLKRKNEKRFQEKLTQTKLDYFTNVSHELLTPLTVISCVTDYWEEHYPSEHQQSGIMRNHIWRLKHLLQQVLDFRKAEKGQMTLKVRNGNITNFLRQVCPTDFLPLARQKQLSINTFIPQEDIWGYMDYDKVDKILYNLVSNAIKYTPSLKNIDFTAEIRIVEDVRHIVVIVRDEGIGIPQKEQERIFTRFYTGTNGKSGLSNGIGLALTKELVELHHGCISVTSRPDKGSTFTVTLPIDREAYRKEEIEEEIIDDCHPSSEEVPACENDACTSEKPAVMFVDDNAELAGMVRKLFSPCYHIITAENGKEALDMLEHDAPDLIISDIMMPEMDGITFCRKVKSQIDTSHIPVILLTARQTSDDQIEGYDAGADGYLSKPFETKVLKARIDNLLRACRERQQTFRTRDRIRLNELEFQAEDTLFLQKMTDYIHAHLDDEDCSLELLASHTNVSKSTLNRKVKAMTGLTPSDFVRNIKLKYACMMLARQNVTVSEVAYATGFSSPKYFTKCFKKEFGITPTEYQQQKNTEKPE